MDWKTFIVNIIDAIAWPFFIWLLIYTFKKELLSFLYRIKRVKYKDNEIELFEKKIEELEKNNKLNIPNELSDAMNKKYYDLINIASLSPRSAIIESFIFLESIIEKSLSSFKKENLPKINYSKIVFLYKKSLISKEEYRTYKKLQKLRNQASHYEDFELKDMLIETYINTALKLATSLEKNSNKT